MTIHWFQLAVALGLLWLPRQILRLGGTAFRVGRHRKRSRDPDRVRDPNDFRVRFVEEITKPRNTIDLLRAALGSVALLGTFEGLEPAFTIEPEAAAFAAQSVFAAPVAVLLIAVFIQTIRFEGRFALFPPIFFLSGISVGICGVTPALFATLLVWGVNFGLPGPGAFLTIYALLLALFGLWFQGWDNKWPLVGAGLVFLPVLLSLMLRRRLALFTKRLKSPSATHA